jgi:hypothetical protein
MIDNIFIERLWGCCRSTGLGLVVLVIPRRSWRDIFCGKLGIGTKKEKRSKKERNGGPVGTDAADGNPLTTRIPTAAWKAQNAFHSSHKARRRFHHRIYLFPEAAVHLTRRSRRNPNGERNSTPTEFNSRKRGHFQRGKNGDIFNEL